MLSSIDFEGTCAAAVIATVRKTQNLLLECKYMYLYLYKVQILGDILLKDLSYEPISTSVEVFYLKKSWCF